MSFYLRNGWFAFREQFSSISHGIAGYLLFPFFLWLITEVWVRFNSQMGNFQAIEVTAYVGVTEILFLTFLRSANVGRSAGDFSITLARPRSWLAMGISASFGRTLGARLIYLVIFFPLLILFGAEPHLAAAVILRLLLLVCILGVVQALLNQLIASAQVLWDQVSYLILPISKIFLVFGGVFGPLADFSEPWRSWLLALPPSDLFFQPAYFCVRGEFYRLTEAEWSVRMGAFVLVLAVLNRAFFVAARRRHQSYGG